MMELPKQTATIFDFLSKGNFINSNSINSSQRELYSVLENQDNFENLSKVFKQIGFQLEAGDGYFYFSREEDKAGIERKIRTAFEWIDILDFFTTFHTGFAPGFRFYTSEILQQLRVNGLLDNTLQEMNSQGRDRSSKEQIDSILKRMEREGYIEKVDEFHDYWKVTSALDYLQKLILALELPDDEEEDESLV